MLGTGRGIAFGLAVAAAGPATAQAICQGYGPQTPRDISATAGENARVFTLAPEAARMNLCNIHFHTNAEHKGPGFSAFAGDGEHGGFRCNGTDALTEAELAPPGGEGGCHGLVPGDTVEVHWVHTSCDVPPGEGLEACLSEACANPELRVEAQVFLVVNDPDAADFADFDYAGPVSGGLNQAKSLPGGTGDPVAYAGSTTGPSYSDTTCSPLQVTWSVRPECAKLDIGSLHAWCADNVFAEDHPHGVRKLVTAPALLAPIP